LRELWSAISPMSYFEKIASSESGGPGKRVLMVYADYDLTFPKEYSLQALEGFKRVGLNVEVKVLPCGHYTTGETPYKFIDGWYMGSFIYRAFKALREERAAGEVATALEPAAVEEEAISQ
jgi:pimeloyl-ACP methyl ester carboxylesterase